MLLSSNSILNFKTLNLEPGTLELDSGGNIVQVQWGPTCGKKLDGILCPGFINTHCHLELSHLKGKVKEKTGMAGFISDLIPLRNNFTEEQIQEAIIAADAEMLKNGIVAVGDISNTVTSYKLKVSSSIYYHTFIELLDLNPSKTEETFAKGLELFKAFGKLPVSLVPHAPYTVTPGLFKKISEWYIGKDLPSCIHHQESDVENDFFSHKGPIWDLFLKMNMDLSWVPKFKNSVEYISAYFNIPGIQYVHNTMYATTDYRLPTTDSFFCTCPNANLYIEDRLPNYNAWIKSGLKITVGTDSLASNRKLSILEELKIIQKACPEISTSALLLWATKNGADFLGISGIYGTLEPGKNPGLLLLQNTGKNGNLLPQTTVERLI